MKQVAADFEISLKRLEIFCHRLDVPIPSDEFWTKKKARKPVAAPELPKQEPGAQDSVKLRVSKRIVLPEPPAVTEPDHEATAKPTTLSSRDYNRLHPKIRFWIDEHKRLQSERDLKRKREQREQAFDEWAWVSDPIIDLTDRDLYRFQATSSLLHAVERAGGKISKTPVTGKLVFVIDGEDVECTVVEKMMRSRRPNHDDEDAWTACPERYQSGLYPTGFLRIEITNHFGDSLKRRWVETTDQKIEDLLLLVVSEITAAGPVLVRQRRELVEWKRQCEQEAEEERQRKQRLRDEYERWASVKELASSWEECRRLEAFLIALREKASSEHNDVVEGRTVTEWIDWAEAKLAKEDPAQRTATELVQAFMPNKWSKYTG